MLSQLSYIPSKVGLTRLELVTSRLSGVRSNQLSYRPMPKLVVRSLLLKSGYLYQQDSGGDVLLERSGRGLQVTCGHSSRPSSTFALTSFSGQLHSRTTNASLRKEVIQPQLPLQLPCYDFVPVTSPALGGSLR